MHVRHLPNLLLLAKVCTNNNQINIIFNIIFINIRLKIFFFNFFLNFMNLHLDRRGSRAYDSDFIRTHDPVGYIPSDMTSIPSSSQFSIPLLPTPNGPFTQDLSQSSVSSRKNAKQQSTSYGGYTNSISSQVPLTQNAYSSQGSISLALSQSDRLRMMENSTSLSHGSLMSQDSSIGYLDDYKSQGDDTIL